MTKRYVISGFVEYFLKVRGKNKLYTCRFENGAVSGLGCVPASFITDKEEAQELLEKTEEFKTGRIKLADVYGEPEKPKGNEVPEVTTMQEARKYLIEHEGAAMEELQNKAAVQDYAAKKNITFPNWR